METQPSHSPPSLSAQPNDPLSLHVNSGVISKVLLASSKAYNVPLHPQQLAVQASARDGVPRVGLDRHSRHQHHLQQEESYVKVQVKLYIEHDTANIFVRPTCTTPHVLAKGVHQELVLLEG